MPTACERRSFPSAASNGDDLLARLGGVLPPSQDAMSNWRPCDAPGMANPMTRQLHLGLNTGRPRETTSCRALRQVFQQRGLSVPRLAAQDQYRAVPRRQGLQQPIKLCALGTAAAQHGAVRRALPPSPSFERRQFARPARRRRRASCRPAGASGSRHCCGRRRHETRGRRRTSSTGGRAHEREA